MYLMGQDVSVGQCHSCLCHAKEKGHRASLVLSENPWQSGYQLLPLCPSFQERGGCGKVLLIVGEGVFASMEVLMCVRVRSDFTPVWLQSPAACFREMLLSLWHFSLPYLCMYWVSAGDGGEEGMA